MTLEPLIHNDHDYTHKLRMTVADKSREGIQRSDNFFLMLGPMEGQLSTVIQLRGQCRELAFNLFQALV